MGRVLSDEIVRDIEKISQRYPSRMAALIPALHLAQNQVGHLPPEVQLEIGELLDVPPTQVREVVTFYTMFSEAPQGRHVVRICRNLSCQLRGAEKIMQKAKEVLGIDFGETTGDGRITLEHEECLASCGTGPALWCDDNFVENLDEKKLESFLGSLK